MDQASFVSFKSEKYHDLNDLFHTVREHIYARRLNNTITLTEDYNSRWGEARKVELPTNGSTHELAAWYDKNKNMLGRYFQVKILDAIAYNDPVVKETTYFIAIYNADDSYRPETYSLPAGIYALILNIEKFKSSEINND